MKKSSKKQVYLTPYAEILSAEAQIICASNNIDGTSPDFTVEEGSWTE